MKLLNVSEKGLEKPRVFLRKILTLLLVFLILLLIGCTTEMVEVLPNETPAAEVPEVTVPEPDEVTEEEPAEEVSGEDMIPDLEETAGNIHIIEVTEDGFEPDELAISIGDTVVWENTRAEGSRFEEAFIIGSQGLCKRWQSEIFGSGEKVNLTFEEAGRCVYVDGIMVTMQGEITVG